MVSPSPPNSRRAFLHGALSLASLTVCSRLIAACGGAGADAPMTAEEALRILPTNGLPDHETGQFPNSGCPFPIRAVPRVYKVARNPEVAAALTPLDYWEFGLAINGVPFDPTGPSFRGDDTSGWLFDDVNPVAASHLGLDAQLAHLQPNGAYHYHALAPTLRDRARGKVMQLGWAADGFPIYGPTGYTDPRDPSSPLITLRSGYRLKGGRRPAGGPGGMHDGVFVEDYVWDERQGDLDQANGRFGATPEFPNGTYHYVLTDTFPYIPRFYRGTPHASFAHPHGPGLEGTPPALRDYRG
jgi:hypothetical protein